MHTVAHGINVHGYAGRDLWADYDGDKRARGRGTRWDAERARYAVELKGGAGHAALKPGNLRPR